MTTDARIAAGVTQSFLDKMIDATPRFVTGIVGSFLGVSLAVVLVLKIGGLDGVVVRLANTYATSLEASMTQLATETDKLSAITENLGIIVADLDHIKSRVTTVEASVATVERTADNAASLANAAAMRAAEAINRVDELDTKFLSLSAWACDQEVRVKLATSSKKSACQ